MEVVEEKVEEEEEEEKEVQDTRRRRARDSETRDQVQKTSKTNYSKLCNSKDRTVL